MSATCGDLVIRAAALPPHSILGEASEGAIEAPSDRDNEDIKEFYLGLTGVGQRKSYRDVKHYRRRKRWLS